MRKIVRAVDSVAVAGAKAGVVILNFRHCLLAVLNSDCQSCLVHCSNSLLGEFFRILNFEGALDSGENHPSSCAVAVVVVVVVVADDEAQAQVASSKSNTTETSHSPIFSDY